jgi:hypothetical protein
MRIAPTGVTTASATSIATTFGNLTDITFDSAGFTMAMLNGNRASGVTGGAVARLFAGSSTAIRIQFSAEL